ncbi:MAG: hypothetical protein EOP51_14960 [Sphingobacteriales bacterium]|nr:MAG: hypothetical protein EOP51_14960 [Sphingobacteriales bacterium]
MTRKTLPLIGIVLLMLCLVHENASAQRRRNKKAPVKKLTIYDVDTLTEPIPRNRIYIHDKIDKEQKRADVSDGTIDHFIYYSEDSNASDAVTKAILKDIDHFQVMIENLPQNGKDAAEMNQEKIRCLTAVWETLRNYNADLRVDPYYYRKLVNNLRELIIARQEGRSLAFVNANPSMQMLSNVKNLFEASSPERAAIYTEMGKREPKVMIKRLAEYANDPFADDIIANAAKVVPGDVFNFASSTNYTLSGAVRRSKDPLVQTIVRISQQSKSPLKAMPFLSDIFNNRKTIEEVDKITSNQDLFYQELVRLKIQNDALGGDAYTDELRYRGLKYVREMNDLHESPDATRFKCIDGFSAESLYYIMVNGQDEIYTSSFLGTYKRMMERMAPRKGDEFLDSLHHDRFRTFIRMCAGYNTLNTFLASMDEGKRTELMTDFIAGLEKGKEDDLEDAVDVADAFGSITDVELSKFLQSKVKENYERAYQQRSKKGLIIYGLLSTLFEGLTASETDESIQKQSEMLDLPPINLVQYKNLVNDSGVVYQQFFFYGDEDGKSSYNSFLGNFKDGKWKVNTSKYWATITSTSGKPIVIYANLPLSEPEDEEAQKQLNKYLAEKEIHPTIMVHRGHSYHLPVTLDYLQKETKIVVLGSCGGYHNLSIVLDHSPDAHIISSKQVGSMSVNEPIIKAINDQLLAGKNINWVLTWKGLETYFSSKKAGGAKSLFVDYVPPHKNLGAIFIKAYRRQFNTDDEE